VSWSSTGSATNLCNFVGAKFYVGEAKFCQEKFCGRNLFTCCSARSVALVQTEVHCYRSLFSSRRATEVTRLKGPKFRATSEDRERKCKHKGSACKAHTEQGTH